MSAKVSSLLLVSLCGLLRPPVHGEVMFRSAANHVALIELYTSEGCSSCPPAEKWLGELRQDPKLWREFVPVAFHVNYWDHLGWRDALASKTFTEREHAYAAAWNAPSVYTPCFVRDGLEWRPRDAATAANDNTADAGILTVRWTAETNTCRIDYLPGVNSKPHKGSFSGTSNLEVSVALLGGGIVNQVRKGENAGRELRHEFVALRLATAALKKNQDGSWSGKVELPPRTDVVAARHALAAWVTPSGKLSPLQATGGWLDESR
jgi:hypothetical protein